MNYQEFVNHLNKKDLHHTYFLCGAEDYLIEDALKRLVEKIVEPATRDFNFDMFWGNEADGGKIVDIASAYPMMSQYRMVVVKDALKLSTTGLDALCRYLEKPSPTTKIVLTTPKADGRSKVVEKIKSKSCFVEFKPLYERQVPQWIRDYLQQKGYAIEQEAAVLLASLVGTNLRAIVNELEKIIINLSGKKISAADVRAFANFSKNLSVFDLTDAIGSKDLSRALMILNLMLQTGESPTGILAMLSRHFVSLLKLKDAMTQRKSQGEMASLAGIPPFFVEKSIKMAEKYSLSEFPQIFERMLETDLALKSSQLSDSVAMQTLIIQITRNTQIG
jgi:DNA polymerase-3 subunit delta